MLFSSISMSFKVHCVICCFNLLNVLPWLLTFYFSPDPKSFRDLKIKPFTLLAMNLRFFPKQGRACPTQAQLAGSDLCDKNCPGIPSMYGAHLHTGRWGIRLTTSSEEVSGSSAKL